MTFPLRTLLAVVWTLSVLAAGCGHPEDPPPRPPPVSCDTGQQQCGDTCVDLQTSPLNCGACGNACSSSQICEAGSCVLHCPSGQEACGGTCVDTRSSAQHCGGCGIACASDQVCRAGSCSAPCPQGQIDCNGVCIDTRGDPQNCGSCGNACNPGRVCGAGQCGACQSGLTTCGQACIDTQTDPQNCGGCGNVCGSGQTCLQGSCRAPTSCTDSLISPKTDGWGTAWDGLERLANTYAAAKQGCESLGARLPTASELFRVNAKQSGTIGSSSANYLWSLAPYAASTQHTVRLSDGLTSTALVNGTTRLTYRCVCAASAPAFTGNACFGPPGQGCFTLKTGGDRYNIDKVDRPLLSKNAAIWECNFQRAHLADFATYAAAIVSGLPGGSGNYLHSGDDSRATKDTWIKWAGTQPTWTAVSNTSAGTFQTAKPFRCAGPNFAPGAHPNTVPDEYVGSRSGYKGEVRNPFVAPWVQAHDECWNRGGHLPRSTELAEIIQEGLPGGDNTWLWTSDQSGTTGIEYTAMVLKWSGMNTAFGYYSPDFVSYAYKSYGVLDRPFRCIYYPLDLQYAGPVAQSCQGGCMRFQLPGATPAVMWMDNQDRPNATLESAAASCANLGGRLASERDFTEAIRRGLPNGTGRALLTADLTYDDRSTTQTPVSRVMVLKWSGTDTNFADSSAYAGWNYLPTSTTALPYRCMWTNELR